MPQAFRAAVPSPVSLSALGEATSQRPSARLAPSFQRAGSFPFSFSLQDDGKEEEVAEQKSRHPRCRRQIRSSGSHGLPPLKSGEPGSLFASTFEPVNRPRFVVLAESKELEVKLGCFLRCVSGGPATIVATGPSQICGVAYLRGGDAVRSDSPNPCVRRSQSQRPRSEKSYAG